MKSKISNVIFIAKFFLLMSVLVIGHLYRKKAEAQRNKEIVSDYSSSYDEAPIANYIGNFK